MSFDDENDLCFVTKTDVLGDGFPNEQTTYWTGNSNIDSANSIPDDTNHRVIATFRQKKRPRQYFSPARVQECQFQRPPKRQKLVNDTANDDWHVVVETCELEGSTKSKSSEISLLEFFSCEAAAGRRRMRCATTDTVDIAAWILWLYRPSLDIRSGMADMLEELDQTLQARSTTSSDCRLEFLQIVDSCSMQDIPLLLTTAYCVAYSDEPLTLLALSEAVSIALRLNYNTELDLITLKRWICHMHSMYFLRIAEQRIHFTKPTMSAFLRSFDLPGLPQGHASFTQICFSQLRRFGLRTILTPWYDFEYFSQTYPQNSLAWYVRQNWHNHYRFTEAEPNGYSLAHELARMISDALINRHCEEVTILTRRRIVNAGHGICDIYNFPVLSRIFESMGADVTYGKDFYLQLLPKGRWNTLSHSVKLCASCVEDKVFLNESSSDFQTPDTWCCVVKSLATLELTTSGEKARVSPSDSKPQSSPKRILTDTCSTGFTKTGSLESLHEQWSSGDEDWEKIEHPCSDNDL